ncbi:phenylalanine--tRNA ligase subunit alpha [Sorangium sp. So ce119]|uniref:phenylalanine--tRNA ligase subunit alpha n=1 Tax=Sorangium TaxID=39643 RepID=UPI00077947FA|nr:phenylalanine--tRNA ligase subunit alpha [Sorangium cellulosum]
MSGPELGRLIDEVDRTVDVQFAAVGDLDELNRLYASLLGRRGSLNALMKQLPGAAPEERKQLGQRLNAVKGRVERARELATARIKRTARDLELSAPPLDITLPGRWRAPGRPHPIMRTLDEIVDIFVGLGFDVAEGPQIELARYNFDLLGFPADHPAMDMHDTFYVAGDPGQNVLLRTHTSPVQVREMLSHPPPVMIVAPGVVYRRDDDASHSPMFVQIEGLVVDRDVSLADLKGLLEVYSRRMFGENTRTRFRPSYFPFTEPSAELDVSCLVCFGANRACPQCKGTGWLEVLGCGMVHPTVLRNVGIDPEVYTGLAFGIGVDRTANMKFAVDDIRAFYENDVRFLGSL